MEEQLISFETAKLAKEKDFNVSCFSYYDLKGNINHNYIENGSSTDVEFRVDLEDLLDNFNRGIPNIYSAPTQSLLQKWLREKYGIFVSVDVNYCYKIYNNDELHKESADYNNYEEALEKGLQEALKLI